MCKVCHGLSFSVTTDKPVFPAASEPYTFVEGEPATVNLTALANPDEVSYEWEWVSDLEGRGSKRVLPEAGPSPLRVRINEGVITFGEVRREDAGVYEVEADNEEGRTTAKIEIDVLYPPK